MLIDSAKRSTLEELTDWTLWAGPQDTRVLTTGVRVSAPPARITQTRFAVSAVWTAVKYPQRDSNP